MGFKVTHAQPRAWHPASSQSRHDSSASWITAAQGALTLGLLATAVGVGEALRAPVAPVAWRRTPSLEQAPYSLQERWISQPLSHAQPDGERFVQRLQMLVPHGANTSSPVFMNIGGEQPASVAHVTGDYARYGNTWETPAVIIEVEHRGFGQSFSQASNQSIPSYVRINETLADVANVMRQLKQEYVGTFAVIGYSYEATLALMLASSQPDMMDLMFGSSGVVDWPFVESNTDKQLRQSLGTTYASLAVHARALQPRALLDDMWVNREFLQTVAFGLGLFPEAYGRYIPAIKFASDYFSTSALIKAMRAIDFWAANSRAWDWASSRAIVDLDRATALRRDVSGRGWAFLQCNELGVFWVADGHEDALFGRDQNEAGYRAYCNRMFGLDVHFPPLEIRGLAHNLSTPSVALVGGRDPWGELELTAQDMSPTGHFIFATESSHDPDAYNVTATAQVRDTMRAIIGRLRCQPSGKPSDGRLRNLANE